MNNFFPIGKTGPVKNGPFFLLCQLIKIYIWTLRAACSCSGVLIVEIQGRCVAFRHYYCQLTFRAT